MNIRKALSATEKTTSTSLDKDQENKNVEKDDEDGDEDVDEEEKLLNEMEEVTRDVERKRKREKKLLAKRRAKDKARKATGMQIDALQDGYVDNELFSLASIKDKEDLATVDATEDVEVDKLADEDYDDNDDADNEADEDSESDDIDSDEERSRYDEKLDKLLDESYERYLAKTGGSTKQRKRAKEAYTDDMSLDDGNDDDNDIGQPDDSDRDLPDEDANPLVVPIDKDRELTQEEIKEMWYSNDIFTDVLDEEQDIRKGGSDDEMHIEELKKALPNKAKEKTKEPHSMGSQNKMAKVVDDLEVVPAPVTDSSESSSSDDESEEYDTDTKCEVLALAKKMLKKRKREEMIDDGYNKRTFDDQRFLPKWFVDDEKRHNQPLKPVTKEEVAAERAQFKEINARPAKKVAEAKARKKRVMMRNLEKVRKKANNIVDQSDIPDRSKRRMIDQLYKKAAAPRKPKKELVVAKKGVQVKAGKGKVLVDRRMKKDARQRGMSKQGKKGKAKGKGMGMGKQKGKGKGGSVKGLGKKGNRGKI